MALPTTSVNGEFRSASAMFANDCYRETEAKIDTFYGAVCSHYALLHHRPVEELVSVLPDQVCVQKAVDQ